ncbi:hypothetical protein, partial [Enterobacter hormaechei]|uniref:hypothetical protein n=1 Tax=Enterobacter hormaechei TaxID=158836 RepID=UPI0013CF9345
LALTGGTAGVTVTLTDGIVRTDRSTLMIVPTNIAALGTTEKILSTTAPTLTNGMVAAWTVIDRNDGSNNRFDFATYNAGTGYG